MKKNLSDRVRTGWVGVIVVGYCAVVTISGGRGSELYMSELLYIEFDELKIFFKK